MGLKNIHKGPNFSEFCRFVCISEPSGWRVLENVFIKNKCLYLMDISWSEAAIYLDCPTGLLYSVYTGDSKDGLLKILKGKGVLIDVVLDESRIWD